MKTNRKMLVPTFLFTLPCIGAEDKKEEFTVHLQRQEP